MPNLNFMKYYGWITQETAAYTWEYIKNNLKNHKLGS